MGYNWTGEDPRIQERDGIIRWTIVPLADEIQCILAVGMFALLPFGSLTATPFSFLAFIFICATCWSMAFWLGRSTFPALRSVALMGSDRIGLEVRGKLRFEVPYARISTARIAYNRIAFEDESGIRLGEIMLNRNARHEDVLDAILARLPEEVSCLKLNPAHVRGTQRAWFWGSCFCLVAGPIMIAFSLLQFGELTWALIPAMLGMVIVAVGLVGLPIGLTFHKRNSAPTWRPAPENKALRAMYRFRMGVPNPPQTFKIGLGTASTVTTARRELTVTTWILGVLFIGIPIALAVQQKSLIGFAVGASLSLPLTMFHQAMLREVALIEKVERTAFESSIYVSGQAMSIIRAGEEIPVLSVTWPIARRMFLTTGSNRYYRVPVQLRTAEGEFLFDITLLE